MPFEFLLGSVLDKYRCPESGTGKEFQIERDKRIAHAIASVVSFMLQYDERGLSDRANKNRREFEAFVFGGAKVDEVSYEVQNALLASLLIYKDLSEKCPTQDIALVPIKDGEGNTLEVRESPLVLAHVMGMAAELLLHSVNGELLTVFRDNHKGSGFAYTDMLGENLVIPRGQSEYDEQLRVLRMWHMGHLADPLALVDQLTAMVGNKENVNDSQASFL